MPKVITAGLLQNLFIGFSTAFQGGFEGVAPQWGQIATRVPSSTKTEEYGWLGNWPKIREWLGDRHVEQLAASTYTIKNKSYETTVKVDRDDIEDDNLGIYGPMFSELGRQVKVFPDELIFALLSLGFTTKCFDGQNFFDTQHPVGAGVQSNNMGGAGTAWFLMDTTRSLKPLIYQDRRPFGFTSLDKPTDENVVMRKEYIYGSDGRCNVGFGFWQMAVGSKQPLDNAGYAAARAAMMALTDDAGRPLGLVPNLLVTGPSLEGASRKVVKNEMLAGGGTNEWAGTATPLVSPYLP